MFDRKHIIVAEHSERLGKLFPPLGAMAITAGAEDPSAVSLISVGLRVEYPRQRQIGRIQLRVLGMNVEDRVTKNSDGRDWIDTLPEHVAGIVVAANGRPR